MNIYTLGFEQTVIVDEYLPLIKSSETGGYTTVFSHISSDFAIWRAILEKALAKRYGNYEHLISGLHSEAVRTLTGAPYVMQSHKDLKEDCLWEFLTARGPHDDFIMVSTESMSDSEREARGLDRGLAFTVLGTVKLSNG